MPMDISSQQIRVIALQEAVKAKQDGAYASDILAAAKKFEDFILRSDKPTPQNP